MGVFFRPILRKAGVDRSEMEINILYESLRRMKNVTFFQNCEHTLLKLLCRYIYSVEHYAGQIGTRFGIAP